MSTFLEKGFLSQSVADSAAEFPKTFPTWAALYSKVNEFAFKQFTSCKINESNVQELLIACCFYRMLTVYESVYLLVERGSDTESKALLRGMVEALFVLGASHKRREFVRAFVLVDDAERIKLLENALAVHESLKADGKPTQLTTEQVNEMRADLAAHYAKYPKPLTKADKKKADKYREETNIKNTAETAGLTYFYKTHYGFLCKFTHPSVEGMRDYLVLDDKGVIAKFKVGPRYGDSEVNMRIAIVMLLTGVSFLAERFELPIEAEISALHAEFNSVIAQSHTLRIEGD